MVAGTIGVGYSGGGFLIWYFLGVAQTLMTLGIVKPGQTPLAGASAGALCLAPQFGAVSMPDMINATLALGERCRANHDCMWTLEEELTRTLTALIKPGTFQKANGLVWSPVSVVQPDGRARLQVISSWSSDADLISTVSSTTYIPMWNAPRVTTRFRGMRVFDGSYTAPLPCPPGVARCIRVATAPPNATAAEMTLWMLSGGVTPVLVAAGNTFKGQDLVAVAKVFKSLPPWDKAALGHLMTSLATSKGLVGTDDIDIYPGKYNPMPWTPSEYAAMSLQPCKPAQCMEMFDLGQADTRSWAKEEGMALIPSSSANKSPK